MPKQVQIVSSTITQEMSLQAGAWEEGAPQLISPSPDPKSEATLRPLVSTSAAAAGKAVNNYSCDICTVNGRITPVIPADEEATDTDKEAVVTANTGSSESRASTPGPGGSGSACENDADAGKADDQDGDGKEINDKVCESEYSEDQQSNDKRGDGDYVGDENDIDELRGEIAAGDSAHAIHKCCGHRHEHAHAKERLFHLPDGRELFSVLLSIHFNDTSIDHSRRFRSTSSTTEDVENIARPDVRDLEYLQTLLEIKFTDLMAGIDPLERKMSRKNRYSLLRYTVKLELFLGSDRVPNMPLKEFMSFGTVFIPGEQALGIIAKIESIVLDAIEYVDDVVAGKYTARHKLKNGLSQDESIHPKGLEKSLDAIENFRAGKDGRPCTESLENKIRYLNFGDGRPLFGVVFGIHFRDTQQHYSRTFESASKKNKDHDINFGLCDLDFKHLMRVIQIPFNDLVKSLGFHEEKDLTADGRREQERCTAELEFLNGAKRSEGSQYVFYRPLPIPAGMAESIRFASESCISDAIKTIDAIAAERQVACHKLEYDPCSVIPDFEARIAVNKDKRNKIEISHLRQIARNAYEQLGKHPVAASNAVKCSDCCSDDACGSADGHSQEHAPSNAPNCCC